MCLDRHTDKRTNGQTDGHTDVTKLTVAFSTAKKATKNAWRKSVNGKAKFIFFLTTVTFNLLASLNFN